jgi:hypothetical protein
MLAINLVVIATIITGVGGCSDYLQVAQTCAVCRG